MTTHSSVCAWKIPWTEEPGRLLSIGSHSQTRLKRLSTRTTQFNLLILETEKESGLEWVTDREILEWVATSFSRGSSQPRGRTRVSYVSCIGRWVLYRWGHLGGPRWRWS